MVNRIRKIHTKFGMQNFKFIILTAFRNAMLKEKIIMPVDGPDENVLKIKSPMCLTIENADEILSRLETVLKQL